MAEDHFDPPIDGIQFISEPLLVSFRYLFVGKPIVAPLNTPLLIYAVNPSRKQNAFTLQLINFPGWNKKQIRVFVMDKDLPFVLKLRAEAVPLFNLIMSQVVDIL